MSHIHLLVLIHGMWGHPGHLAELRRIAEEVHAEPSADGTKLEVLAAETNAEKGTYDGIDWGGERVAQEVGRLTLHGLCACVSSHPSLSDS